MTKGRGRVTLGTWLLLGVLVLCYLATLDALGTLAQVGGGWWEALTASFAPDALRSLGAIDPARVRAGEWWRLGTAPFLHGSGVHLLLNGLALLVLGKALERHAGAAALLAAFAAGALGSGVASVALGAGITVGASGAVLGLAGALYATLRGPSMTPESARASRRRLVRLLVLVFGVGIVWNAVADVGTTKISNAGHLGGLLGGALLGALLPAPGARASLPRRLLGGVAQSAALLGLCALAGLGASQVRLQLDRRPEGVDIGTWLGVGGDLRVRELPEVRARLGVPETWRVLERRAGYVALGPSPGSPFLQLRRIPAGGPEDVPDAVVYRMQRSHPELIAAPIARVTISGRRAVRLEMEYGARGEARMQQVRFHVSDPKETLHVIFLGQPPLARHLADWIVATLRVDP